MAARIRSLRNGINPIDEASRDDLVVGDVVSVQALDAATTYAWILAFVPEGSTATFSGSSTSVTPGSFTVDLPGSYLIRLTVDATLPTESTQYVRLRAVTAGLGLKLVAAGERRDASGIIPVDADPEGWANDQNANLLALEAAAVAALAIDLQGAYNNGNLVVLTNATTPIVVQAGAAPSAQLVEFRKSSGDSLGGFLHSSANVLRLTGGSGVGTGNGVTLSLHGGSATGGNGDGGDVRIRPGAASGTGSTGELVLQDATGANEVGFFVSGANTVQIRTPGGGGLPLVYNTSTGKLTVPGLIDPTGLIFEFAAQPTTGASEGALYVSNGTNNQRSGSLYFRGQNDDTPVNVSASSGIHRTILHAEQLRGDNVGNIRPATAFLFDPTVTTNLPADGNTLTLNNGFDPPETYTFRTTPTLSFEVAIGATVIESMTNLAAAINANSTQFGAKKVNDLTRLHSNNAARGHAVVIFTLGASHVFVPRLYGTFASSSNARACSFHLDQTDYNVNNIASLIPTSDPGTQRFFGYRQSGLSTGQVRVTASEPSLWLYQNATPTNTAHWVQIGPGGGVRLVALTGVSASTTLDRNDRFVHVTLASSAVSTLNLPAADRMKGVFLAVRRVDSDSGSTLNLTPVSGQQIDGLASRTVAPQTTAIITSDGTAWYTVGNIGASSSTLSIHKEVPPGPGTTVRYRGWMPVGCVVTAVRVYMFTVNTVGNYTATFTNRETSGSLISPTSFDMNTLVADTVTDLGLGSLANRTFSAKHRWVAEFTSDNAGFNGDGIYFEIVYQET